MRYIKHQVWQNSDTQFNSSFEAGCTGGVTATTDGAVRGVVEQFPPRKGTIVEGHCISRELTIKVQMDKAGKSIKWINIFSSD